MRMSGAHSAAEDTGFKLEKPVSLQPDNMCEAYNDRDEGHAEKIWDVQDLSYQSDGGVSALQRIQLLCERAVLNVPRTVFKSQKLIAQG